MGRLFAKETERRHQEMEMGREMKRRKNIEAIGEVAGKDEGRDTKARRKEGKEGAKDEWKE